MMKKLMAFLVVLVLFSCFGFSQIPKSIGITGKVMDFSGTPLEGDYIFRFEIYNTVSGGSCSADCGGDCLWCGESAITVKNGVFTALLGDELNALDLGFDEQYYVKIIFSGQGLSKQEFSKRFPLSSAPYSLGSVEVTKLFGTVDIENLGWENTFPSGVLPKISDIGAKSIGSSQIIDGSIAEIDLGKNSVTSIKIADGTITGGDIDSDTITDTNLAENSVGNSELGTDAVRSGNIKTGEVKSADIGSGEVKEADLGTGSVNSTHIQDGAVTKYEIDDDAVTSAKILDGQVKSSDIDFDAVNEDHLAPGSVGSSELTLGVITANHFAVPFITSSTVGDLIADNSIPSSKFRSIDASKLYGGPLTVSIAKISNIQAKSSKIIVYDNMILADNLVVDDNKWGNGDGSRTGLSGFHGGEADDGGTYGDGDGDVEYEDAKQYTTNTYTDTYDCFWCGIQCKSSYNENQLSEHPVFCPDGFYAAGMKIAIDGRHSLYCCAV